jgi:hypothetical protein
VPRRLITSLTVLLSSTCALSWSLLCARSFASTLQGTVMQQPCDRLNMKALSCLAVVTHNADHIDDCVQLSLVMFRYVLFGWITEQRTAAHLCFTLLTVHYCCCVPNMILSSSSRAAAAAAAGGNSSSNDDISVLGGGSVGYNTSSGSKLGSPSGSSVGSNATSCTRRRRRALNRLAHM